MGQKKKNIETFFADSFKARKAEIIIPFDEKDYKIRAVVKIYTSDTRGNFFIGEIEKVKK